MGQVISLLCWSLYAAADTAELLASPAVDLQVDLSIIFWSCWPTKLAHIWQLELARI
jgi:hypothetical protein